MVFEPNAQRIDAQPNVAGIRVAVVVTCVRRYPLNPAITDNLGVEELQKCRLPRSNLSRSAI